MYVNMYVCMYLCICDTSMLPESYVLTLLSPPSKLRRKPLHLQVSISLEVGASGFTPSCT